MNRYQATTISNCLLAARGKSRVFKAEMHDLAETLHLNPEHEMTTFERVLARQALSCSLEAGGFDRLPSVKKDVIALISALS